MKKIKLVHAKGKGAWLCWGIRGLGRYSIVRTQVHREMRAEGYI